MNENWNSYLHEQLRIRFVPRQIHINGVFYSRFIFKSSIPFSSIVSRFREHPVSSEGECAPPSPQTSVHDHRLLLFFSSPVCTYVIEYVSSQLSRSFTTNSPISTNLPLCSPLLFHLVRSARWKSR